jgi:NAD(P)H-quinone oxidoreductase subunit 6
MPRYPPASVMPSMHSVMFFLLAALALGSAGVVALSKNIIYSALALLGTFLGVAGLYITLSADFLAATQLLVYVGGTLTLILFAVMLTARIENLEVSNPKQGFWAAFALVPVVLLVLGRVAAATSWGSNPLSSDPLTSNPSTAKLGHAFLDGYLLPFEVGSVVLLAALVGSVVLARRAVRPEADKE